MFEIDYEKLIEAAFTKNKKWAQGTTGCIAFARGAEWFREQVQQELIEKARKNVPAQEIEHNNAPAVPQVSAIKSALNGLLTFFGMDEDENSKPVFDKARKALTLEFQPYTTIDLGHGKFDVGACKNGGLPCIAFGRNGTGKVGEPITAEPRQMSVEETFAVITFANVTGLDVLQEKMDQVREEFFPGTTPQFSATPAPSPAVPAEIDVRTILLDIVPGDGNGHEVYAKTVEDVVNKLTKMAERLEDAERERDYYKRDLKTMYGHQKGEVWYWQGDGQDHPESWVNSLPVVIRADQLRELIAKPAQEVGMTDAWLLEQFKNYPNWELSTSNDPECDPSVFWLVHEVKGGRNDREWFLIGEGDSPRAAIIAALRAKENK